MENDNYKNILIHTVKNLAEIRETLFLRICELSDGVEIQELRDGLIGVLEIYNEDDYKDSDDVNIQHLFTLLNKFKNTYELITIINDINLRN